MSVERDKLLAVRTVLSTFHIYARSLMAPLEQRELTADGWVLDDPRVLRLLEKLRGKGVKLGEFVDGKFYYGIKTGYNDAFVIDDAKRLELIAADPKSAEIIKPYLRGKDVRRWSINYKNLHLIFTRRGIRIDEYPVIKAYLETFRVGLEPKPRGWVPLKSSDKWPGRKEGTYKWFEIQDSIDYFDEFDSIKVIYPDMSFKCHFAIDESCLYPDCTLFTIPNSPRFLLPLLNSSLIEFFTLSTTPRLESGAFRFKSIYLEQLPIVTPTPAQQIQLEGHTDDSRLDELNALVYEMYGLNAGEIALIESLTGGAAEALEEGVLEDEGEALEG